MRYRSGPIAGTVIMTVLFLLGAFGEVTLGFRPGQSIASCIFGLVVILMFGWFAVNGLNDLRGVRTSRRPDGSAVLELPIVLPQHGRWRQIVPAADIEDLDLVGMGRRSRLFTLAVWLRDGSQITSGAVSTNRPWRRDVDDTRAGRMVERMRHDLGLDQDAGRAVP